MEFVRVPLTVVKLIVAVLERCQSWLETRQEKESFIALKALTLGLRYDETTAPEAYGMVRAIVCPPTQGWANKIFVIKAVREVTGFGLKEAKDAVDQYQVLELRDEDKLQELIYKVAEHGTVVRVS